ncbi:MAG: DUF3078 domain-containing protein [Candidatus Cloacimonadales bacterium]
MKKGLLLLMIIAISTAIFAEGWKTNGNVALTMSQQAYSDNWAGEENSSISWIFGADFLAEKQLMPLLHNKNTLKLAFGQTHNQFLDEQDETYWAKPDKSTDLIDLKSRLRFTLGSFVDPYVSARLESQLIDKSGMETEIFNPNILTEALGLARVFIKTDDTELSTSLGAAFKQYFDKNQDESSNDGGIEFIAEYNTPLLKQVIDYKSSLNLYQPLYYSESETAEYLALYAEDDWQTLRMDWQNDLDIKLNSVINLKLYFQLIYHKLENEDLQFKETLGLGLSYKLF